MNETPVALADDPQAQASPDPAPAQEAKPYDQANAGIVTLAIIETLSRILGGAVQSQQEITCDITPGEAALTGETTYPDGSYSITIRIDANPSQQARLKRDALVRLCLASQEQQTKQEVSRLQAEIAELAREVSVLRERPLETNDSQARLAACQAILERSIRRG